MHGQIHLVGIRKMSAVHSLVCTYFKMIWWPRWYQVQQRLRPWRPLPKPSSSEWKRKWFSCTNEHSEPTNDDDDQLLLPNHLLNQHELNFVNFSVQNLGTTKLAWTLLAGCYLYYCYCCIFLWLCLVFRTVSRVGQFLAYFPANLKYCFCSLFLFDEQP